MAQAVANHMIAHEEGGSIINMASIMAHRASLEIAAYCASKAAIEQLTTALAVEVAKKGIRVNALAPGFIPTDMTRDYLKMDETLRGGKVKRAIPVGRYGEIHELDGPLLLLASDVGSFMTGSTLVVDGGQSSYIDG